MYVNKSDHEYEWATLTLYVGLEGRNSHSLLEHWEIQRR